jgi:hypothetical protein
MQTELETAHRKNVGRRNTKENNEIPAKIIQSQKKDGWVCEAGTDYNNNNKM